ncbi:MAG: hypothetical protein ACE5QF_02035, partial [Thermoplasmata archaeon]
MSPSTSSRPARLAASSASSAPTSTAASDAESTIMATRATPRARDLLPARERRGAQQDGQSAVVPFDSLPHDPQVIPFDKPTPLVFHTSRWVTTVVRGLEQVRQQIVGAVLPKSFALGAFGLPPRICHVTKA